MKKVKIALLVAMILGICMVIGGLVTMLFLAPLSGTDSETIIGFAVLCAGMLVACLCGLLFFTWSSWNVASNK